MAASEEAIKGRGSTPSPMIRGSQSGCVSARTLKSRIVLLSEKAASLAASSKTPLPVDAGARRWWYVDCTSSRKSDADMRACPCVEPLGPAADSSALGERRGESGSLPPPYGGEPPAIAGVWSQSRSIL